MSDEITPEELSLLEVLLKKATPGPYQECGHARGGCQCGMVWSLQNDVVVCAPFDCADEWNGPVEPTESAEQSRLNARAVARLFNAAPALIAKARRLLLLESAAEHVRQRDIAASGRFYANPLDTLVQIASDSGWTPDE